MILRFLRHMPFDRREPGFWLSGIAHAGLLVAGLVAFTAETLPESQEGIPVEIVTDSQVSEIPRGENAPEVKDKQERADRESEQRVANLPGEAEQDVPTPPTRPAEVKVDDEEAVPPPLPPARPDIAKAEAEAARAAAAAKAEAAAKAAAAARAAAAAKAAEAAKVEAAKAEALKAAQREEAEERAEAERAAAKSKAQAEAKARAEKAQAEAKTKAEKARAEAKAKADAESKAALEKKLAEAEADAKEKAEAEAAKAAEERRKVAEAKARADAKAKSEAKAKADAEAKARRQAAVAERFNPGDISRLVGTEAPQGSGASARQVQRTASLGAASGQAARLNPSQLAQIRGLIAARLLQCWQPPIATQSMAKPPVADVRILLKEDGSLAAQPAVVNSSSDPLFRPVADAALRAASRCSPIRIPAQFIPLYEGWKELRVSFDPKETG